jgi:hypothetical protein
MKIEIENTEESIAEAIQAGITTPEMVAKWLDYEVEEYDLVDDIIVVRPHRWLADDGNARIEFLDCDSAEEAADEYVSGGDWGDRSETSWVSVMVWREGVNADGEIVEVDEERITATLEAIEPPCIDGNSHDWQSPHEIVGGLHDNPGVNGHGGGIIYTEVCMRCGCARITDTWAQNPADGEQGLTSVAYDPGRYVDEI